MVLTSAPMKNEEASPLGALYTSQRKFTAKFTDPNAFTDYGRKKHVRKSVKILL